jgi:hypothetical protein
MPERLTPSGGDVPTARAFIYEGGKVVYKSAKTRSWEQAEKAPMLNAYCVIPLKEL